MAFNQFIRPACISQVPDNPKSFLVATGLGRITGDDPTNSILKVTNQYVSLEKCKRAYNTFSMSIDNETQVCAGGTNDGYICDVNMDIILNCIWIRIIHSVFFIGLLLGIYWFSTSSV